MKKRALIFLTLICPLLASARMGETREQCERRYGLPVNVQADGAVVFRKDDIEVTTYFDASNRVEWIEYRAPDLSFQLTRHLMQVSAAEQWFEDPLDTYHAENARLTAVALPHQYLRIYPDDWEARKAAREKQRLEEKRRVEEDKRRLDALPKLDLKGF